MKYCRKGASGSVRRMLQGAWLCLACCSLLFLALGPSFAAEPLVIGSSYSPPLSTEKQDGFFDLLLKEAGKRIGRDVSIMLLPAERSLQDANSGRIDGDVGRVKAIARIYPNLRRVPEPVLPRRDFVAFSLGAPFATSSWEALEPFNVGYVRGWKIFEENTRGAASALGVDSTEKLFELLQRGRVDVALNARLDGLAMARKLGMENVQVMEPPLASMRMYLYLYKAHEALCEPLAQALRDMEADGTTAAIAQGVEIRYLNF